VLADRVGEDGIKLMEDYGNMSPEVGAVHPEDVMTSGF
jgi:hypothetical protein